MQTEVRSDQRQFEDPSIDDGIDLARLTHKLRLSIIPMIGFACLGAVCAAVIGALALRVLPQETDMRIAFSFPGFEKGEYPDGSKFLPDDLCSPDIVLQALRRPGSSISESEQARLRGAFSVSPIIPPSVVKERDRLRASGQTVPLYVPDEYSVTLALRGSNLLGERAREELMSDVLRLYGEKFRRTYAVVPLQFGTAFDMLGQADYFEYEFILKQDLEAILRFLDEQRGAARTFRSPISNLSFNDLYSEAEYFSQIKLNEVLGLIQSSGVSKDRRMALLKMDYHTRILTEEEKKLSDSYAGVRDLMDKVDNRNQSYVLGVKSQLATPRGESPLIDKGLIDSLVQNDSYNFLVRKALDAGNRVREVTARRYELQERRKQMESFANIDPKEQTVVRSTIDQALINVRTDHQQLVEKIRRTVEDFARQQYADAVRLTMQPQSDPFWKKMVIVTIVGGVFGCLLGLGLTLVGVYDKRTK